MDMTAHANVRRQQRAIPPLMIDLLLQFGASEPSGDGTLKYYFDKSSRRQVMAYAGAFASALEQHLDLYAVVAADSRVITVAHRDDRIRRH
jgi:hypothetical protein